MQHSSSSTLARVHAVYYWDALLGCVWIHWKLRLRLRLVFFFLFLFSRVLENAITVQ